MEDLFESAMASYPTSTIEQLIRNWSVELHQAKWVVKKWPEMIKMAEEEVQRRKRGCRHGG